MRVESYGAEAFGRDAAARFPAFAGEFEEDLGLLHSHMATLARIARQALTAGDRETIRRVSAFVEEALLHPRAVSEIENAVAISFLTRDDFIGSPDGQAVFEQLPDRIRMILLEQERRDSL